MATNLPRPFRMSKSKNTLHKIKRSLDFFTPINHGEAKNETIEDSLDQKQLCSSSSLPFQHCVSDPYLTAHKSRTRSGTVYNSPSNTANMSPPTQTVRVLPTPNFLKQFTGDDPSYGIHVFLRHLEDAFVQADIKEDKDKIRFVRGHIAPASPASLLLTASAFTDPVNLTSYKQFRESLVDVFGEGQLHGSLSWVQRMANLTRNNLFALEPTKALALAGTTALDAKELLSSSTWVNANDTVTLPNVIKLIEFIQFQLLLKENLQLESSKYTFGPTDQLIKLAAKLTAKNTPIPSALNVAAVEFKPNVNQHAQNSKTKYKGKFCTYCKRTNHTIKECYILQNKNKNNQNNQYFPQKYCILHECDTHSSEECRTILSLKHNMQNKPYEERNTLQSGESRRWHNQPRK